MNKGIRYVYLLKKNTHHHILISSDEMALHPHRGAPAREVKIIVPGALLSLWAHPPGGVNGRWISFPMIYATFSDDS